MPPYTHELAADVEKVVSLNSLVLHLLRQRIRSAKKRHAKSLDILRRAYISLRACPVSFDTFSQLHQLSGFESEALQRELHHDLVQWCESHGHLALDYGAPPSSSTQSAMITNSARKKNTSATTNASATEAVAGEAQATQKNPAEKTNQEKRYIPQSRSGSHGILVSLYSLTAQRPDPDDSTGKTASFSKMHIISFAQPFSDAQFLPRKTTPGFGPHSFHSAWSGMKTLINRGYVYRRGNPARFALSETGWDVAAVCAEREAGIYAGCNAGEDAAKESVTQSDTEVQSGLKDVGHSSKACPSPSKRSSPFRYVYLTNRAKHTLLRQEAQVKLSDSDYCLRYRVAFLRENIHHVFAVKCLDEIQPCPDNASLLCGWVHEAACNEIAPGLQCDHTPHDRQQALPARPPLNVPKALAQIEPGVANSPPARRKKRPNDSTNKQKKVARDASGSSDLEIITVQVKQSTTQTTDYLCPSDSSLPDFNDFVPLTHVSPSIAARRKRQHL